MPQLAIVDRALFDEVQRRKASRSHAFPNKQRKPKRLFSGLLKCHRCGGGISVKDRDHGRVRVHCSTRREAGTCDNTKTYYLDSIETAVLDGLQQHLKSPDLLAEFVSTYQAERLRLQADRRNARTRIENELAQVERSIARLWRAFEDEAVSMTVAGPKLEALEADKQRLTARLAEQEPEDTIVSLHPAAIARYKRYVENLSQAFDDGISPDNADAAVAIRDLIEKVVVGHDADGKLKLRVHGRLAALTEAPNLYPNMRIAASGGTVVAEEGLEPPTHGL